MSKFIAALALVILSLVPFGCSEDLPCILYPVYAQTSSPSSSLKEKLKALDAEIASKAAALLPNINKRLQNKAYVGFIKAKSSSSLTIAAKSGSYIVNINDYTVYELGKKNTFEALAIDDYIAALGDIDDTDVLTAKKIVRFPAPINSEKQIFGGTVTAITAQTITLHSFDNKIKTVDLTAKTTYQFGVDATDLSTVKVGKVIYVVGQVADSKLAARFVYIVPYTLTIPKSTPATASASPSASSSAKKK